MISTNAAVSSSGLPDFFINSFGIADLEDQLEGIG
jgi:hypothetical protein